MLNNQIEIGFQVDSDDLTAGLADATQQVGDAAAAIQGKLADLGDSARSAIEPLKTLAQQPGSSKAIEDDFAAQAAGLNEIKSLYKISADEAIAQQVRTENERYAALRDELDAENQALAANDDARQRLQAKADALELRHNTKVRALQQQEVKESEAQWSSLLAPVSNAFQSSLNGIIRGNETLRQAMAKMGQSVVTQFADMAVKRATNWIVSELTMTEASEAGDVARTASATEANDFSLIGMLEKVIKSITMDAAESAAGVTAFLAPMLGPAAIPEGVATQSLLLAFIPSLSAAGGAWSLPGDMLVQAHAKESILPAAIAGPMRSFFENGGAVAGGQTAPAPARGGDIHIHAVDAASFQRLLSNNKSAVAKTLRAAARGFDPSLSLA